MKHFLHCAVIGFLYLCQGVVQGTLAIIVLILLQRHPDLSAADQATLGLPMYSFSLKFLWAPLIDRFYFSWSAKKESSSVNFLLNRRAQWVLVLQVLMAICYFVLYKGGDDFLESVVHSGSAFFKFWILLVVLAFLNASQDVAVDAWAVEGLPREEASTAGLLQLLGTVSGVCISNFFVQLNSWDSKLYSIEMFCVASGTTCILAALSSVVLSVLDRLPHEELLLECGCGATPNKGVWATLKDLFQNYGVRELIAILLTRFWPMATWFLVISRLISMGVISAATFAQYRIYSMILQLLLGSSMARRLLKSSHAARVIQFVSGVDFFLSIVLSLFFVFLADPSVKSWFGPAVVLPLIMVVTALSAFSFVANVELCSHQAHQFPRDVGGVLSLLNAISNIGHHVPSTLCMYGAHLIVLVNSYIFQTNTSYGSYYQPKSIHEETESLGSLKKGKVRLSPWVIKSDVITLSIAFFLLAAILRYKYLVPSVHFLTSVKESETVPLHP